MTNNKAEGFANADDIISGYKNSPKRIKRLRKSIKSGKVSGQIIIPPRNKNIDLVAHEIGHASNATSTNPIVKSTHKRANKISGESDSKFGMLTSKMGTHRRSGLKNIIRDFIDEESLIAEESRASRKGLKILRKSGATKQKLDQAKANYKIGLDSYKGKGRANWKSTLRNTIQTEDKRGGSFRDD